MNEYNKVWIVFQELKYDKNKQFKVGCKFIEELFMLELE